MTAPNHPEQPEGEGWVTWAGGNMPVAPDTPVQIRRRFESEYDNTQPVRKANLWHWSFRDRDSDGDIIAYRVATP